MIFYKIKLDKDALSDIEEISNWYDRKVYGLGKRFKRELKGHINLLKKNPNNFACRYNDVHCLLMKRFPFLAHYKIDCENQVVIVFAIIHTSRNPKIWEERSKDI